MTTGSPRSKRRLPGRARRCANCRTCAKSTIASASFTGPAAAASTAGRQAAWTRSTSWPRMRPSRCAACTNRARAPRAASNSPSTGTIFTAMPGRYPTCSRSRFPNGSKSSGDTARGWSVQVGLVQFREMKPSFGLSLRINDYVRTAERLEDQEDHHQRRLRLQGRRNSWRRQHAQRAAAVRRPHAVDLGRPASQGRRIGRSLNV